MVHLRIFVNLGFWKPCIKAEDVDESNGIFAALSVIEAFAHGVITHTTSPVGTTTNTVATHPAAEVTTH